MRSGIIASLFIGCICVGAVWFAMEHAQSTSIRSAIERDGYTDITMTGERPGSGRWPVYGFEATNRKGERVVGYVADERGGIVRVVGKR